MVLDFLEPARRTEELAGRRKHRSRWQMVGCGISCRFDVDTSTWLVVGFVARLVSFGYCRLPPLIRSAHWNIPKTLGISAALGEVQEAAG